MEKFFTRRVLALINIKGIGKIARVVETSFKFACEAPKPSPAMLKIQKIAGCSVSKEASTAASTIGKSMVKASSYTGADIGRRSSLEICRNSIPIQYEDFEKMLSDYIRRIPYSERDNVKCIFIGNAFGDSSNEIINRFLRNGAIPQIHPYWNKETLKTIVKDLNKIMDKSNLSKDSIVYRGVKNLDFLPQKGEIFVEKGFMSTTTSKKTAESLYSRGGGMIEIILPKNTNYIINDNHCELLLRNNSRFLVLENNCYSARLLKI